MIGRLYRRCVRRLFRNVTAKAVADVHGAMSVDVTVAYCASRWIDLDKTWHDASPTETVDLVIRAKELVKR